MAHHLAHAVRSGQAIHVAAGNLSGDGLMSGTTRRHCSILAEGLAAGVPLSAILAGIPRSFTRSEVALVAAGEATGNVADGLEAWERWARDRWRLRRLAFTTLAYPVLVLFAGSLAAMAIIASHVLPTFAEMYARVGRSLDTPARIMVSLGALDGRSLLAGAAILIALGIASRLAHGSSLPPWLHRALLAVPVAGPLRRRQARCMTLAVVASFVRVGRGLPEALRHAAAAQSNAWFTKSLAELAARLDAGEALGTTLTAPFDRATTLTLRAALSSADPASATAALAERETLTFERRCRRLAAILPSLAVMAISTLVGFIVIATYETLFGMAGHIP